MHGAVRPRLAGRIRTVMCGIAGWVGEEADEPGVAAMVDALAARGPDDRGVVRTASHCVLGHTRLAIMDLSAAGTQPMHDGTRRVWAVVNGEIYNHQALRRELNDGGAIFRSSSDSEVVVHGYLAWGAGVVEKLQGIFAFAVYDTYSGELLLARDRVGVKPLYYAYDGRQLIFASELKAILASRCWQLEYQAISMQVYLAHRYLPAPLTPYRNVYKLEAGHLLHCHSGEYQVKRYWQATPQTYDDDPATLHEQLLETIDSSVDAQLMSDAPLGLLLSGGVDSSSIAIIAASHGQSPQAFCCGFEQDTHDERRYARMASKAAGVPLQTMEMSWSGLKKNLPAFLDWFDEPFFNYSAIAIYELSRMARDRGIKVLLAGEGADEVFAGYLWYDDFATRTFRSHDEALDTFFGYYGFFTGAMQDELAGRVTGFDHLAVLRRIDQPELDPVSRAQWLDFHTFLPDDILCRDDRASMAAGIELRVPYLDERIVDRYFLLPQALVYQNGQRKALLKQALSRIVPASILTNRKKGFGFPFYAWETPIRKLAAKVLCDGMLVGWGHASPMGVQRVLTEYNIDFVWLLLTAELWMQRFLGQQQINDLIDNAG